MKKKIINIINLIVVIITISLIVSCKATKNKIIYDLDGGSLNQKVEVINKKETITLSDPVKPGYTFNGWYTTSDFEGNKITEVIGNGKIDIYLFASWIPNTIAINYELNGGYFDVEYPTSYKYNEEIDLVEPKKNDYHFVGWYTNKDYLGDEVISLEGILDNSITLYAKWNKYSNIEYELNGGVISNKAPKRYIEGEELTLLTPTKRKNHFLGWYLDNNFLTKIEKIEETTKGHITLYAKWESFSYVTLIANGGVLCNELLEVTVDDEFELEIPIKEGYIFLGWYSDDTFVEKIDKINKNTTQDLVLYAKWGIPHSINYNANGGTMPDEYSNYYIEEQEQILPTPTKDGYKFIGWTERPNSQNPPVYFKVPVSYSYDINLTAVWQKVTYRIYYNLGPQRYISKSQLYVDFFSDFYKYITEYKNMPNYFSDRKINDVEEFLAFCSGWTGGGAGMGEVGNLLGSFYLKKDVGGSIENQKASDGYIGYCLENNKYVEFIYFIKDFFYWWRMDEGYTGGSDDPDNVGSDFLASPWASIVDTAKFFYFEKDTLPSYFIKKEHVPSFYDRIPYIIKADGEITEVYDFEKTTKLPTSITISGYRFDGWYLNEDFTGEKITTLEKNIYHDITVYAKFTKIEG